MNTFNERLLYFLLDPFLTFEEAVRMALVENKVAESKEETVTTLAA